MARVLIDARESGTSTGRYIDKLIENLHKLQPWHEFIIITKKSRINFIKEIAPSFRVIETQFKEFTFGEQIGLKKQIESLHPDLVHFGIVQQPVLYIGRAVTTMHDLTTVRFKNPAKNPIIFTLKQQVYKWVNKRVARKSIAIITPTEFVKNDVAQFTRISPDKITVTLEAADAITAPSTSVKSLFSKQFIMYIGRPTPHKNLGRLIDAFEILQKNNPDLYLVLAGKKDVLYDQHAAEVTNRGIKNVIFTGFVSDGELRWLYENTACYVFPSLSEGFGLPGLEAMAHGAPVASSNATCLPEVHGDAAKYFDPYDSGGVAKVVSDIINNKTLANDLKLKGYAQVKKYSWERMAQETLDVYNKALDS
jgi:glycosyltransferase involved in cell wall biosynthesis